MSCLFQGLSEDDLGDLIEDMKLYLEIDEGKNHQFWQVDTKYEAILKLLPTTFVSGPSERTQNILKF